MLHPKAWYEMRLSGCWTYEVLTIPFVATGFFGGHLFSQPRFRLNFRLTWVKINFLFTYLKHLTYFFNSQANNSLFGKWYSCSCITKCDFYKQYF